jgi:hypothetical protein
MDREQLEKDMRALDAQLVRVKEQLRFLRSARDRAIIRAVSEPHLMSVHRIRVLMPSVDPSTIYTTAKGHGRYALEEDPA